LGNHLAKILSRAPPVSLTTAKRDFSQLRSDLHGISALIRAIPQFLRERTTLQRAEEEIKKAFDDREKRFLELVRSRVFERPTSPYLKLLRVAGCEFSDLQREIRRSGIEATLKRLAREGVYFTSEEFKGKKEVIRSGQSFRVVPELFGHRGVSAGYQTQSSGTTNDPIRSFVSLDLLRIRTPATYFFFVAHDLFSHAHAMYDAILPGSAGINNLLIYAKMGVLADRWFARKVPIKNKLESIHHSLTTQLVVLAAKYFHPSFPRPEFIDSCETDRIVRWTAKHQAGKKASCITTAASNATKIARIACELGISLEGTKFIVTGEPFTESKKEVLQKAGATATPRYAYGGSINIGFGCANPLHTDEIHVNQHQLALFSNPRLVEKNNPCLRPLLCTTLDTTFPRLLLNVESGDYGYLTHRDCGCALEKAGLTLHLHHIRSFEKFTSEGMNYFYGDLFVLFEDTLPAEFGGGPGDYQLVEEEDSKSQTRLTLVVHPGVGELNEQRLLARLRAALADGSRGNRFMTRVWQDAGTFRVKREVPYASARGKILPLHFSHEKDTGRT
jgi:hypothetical protein